jgi:hypothetical protein
MIRWRDIPDNSFFLGKRIHPGGNWGNRCLWLKLTPVGATKMLVYLAGFRPLPAQMREISYETLQFEDYQPAQLEIAPR